MARSASVVGCIMRMISRDAAIGAIQDMMKGYEDAQDKYIGAKNYHMAANIEERMNAVYHALRRIEGLDYVEAPEAVALGESEWIDKSPVALWFVGG